MKLDANIPEPLSRYLFTDDECLIDLRLIIKISSRVLLLHYLHSRFHHFKSGHASLQRFRQRKYYMLIRRLHFRVRTSTQE